VRFAAVLACVVAGCGFSAELGIADAASDDASVTGNEPLVFAPCTMRTSGTLTNATALGGDGGDPREDITCAADELPTGIGFDVSSDGISSHGDQIAMVNVRVRCARVTRRTDGAFDVQPGAQVSRSGGMGGNCSAYFPTVAAPEVTCAAGHVLVGLTGNRIDSSLYNTVSIVCSPLASDGSVMAPQAAQAIAETGTESNQPQTASCGPQSAIAAFAVRSGCGQDQLLPRCATVACQ
jgi:hypothetical protein